MRTVQIAWRACTRLDRFRLGAEPYGGVFLSRNAMLIKKLMVGSALAVGVLGMAFGAHADTVTFSFGGATTTWNGTPYPNSNATYLTATFTDTGLGKVDLTLTANLPVG